MPDLHSLATDPAAFAARYIRYKHQPITFHPWQERFARTTDFLRSRAVLRAGRQVGKTLLVSILCLAYANMHPDTTIHIFSASVDQAGNVYRYVCNLIDQSPAIARRVKKANGRALKTKDQVVFVNGSRIAHHTAGVDGRYILGHSCEGKGTVILDECAYVKSSAARQIMPIANNAGLILCSTPRFPTGFFYDCSKSGYFDQYHIPAILSPLYTEASLKAIKDVTPPSDYRQCYLAEFSTGGAEQVFDPVAVEEAVDKSLPVFDPHGEFRTWDRTKNYIWSLDPSQLKHDRTVFMIGYYDLGSNSVRLVAYHVFAPLHQHTIDSVYRPVATFTDSHEQVVSIIESYREKYHPVRFYIDSSDLYYSNEFKKRIYPVEECRWSDTNKERYIQHLSAVFNSRKIQIPNDDWLLNEVYSFSYDAIDTLTGGQRRRYAEGWDDGVSALAMLSLAVTTGSSKDWQDWVEVL